MSETEQLVQARQGDQEAWAKIVRQHQDAVFRLAYLLLGNADDAADVAQETFLRAWRNLDRFDPTRPLRPWLLEITRNQCFNWQRSVRRYLAALGRWGEVQPVATQPDDAAAQTWQALQLWQAIRRLQPADQEVIYLRCFLELSVEETALALTIAPGTVKSRFARALERLRAVIEHELPGLQPGFREEVAE